MAKQIEFNDMTITDVMSELDKRGISGTSANLVAAGWILQNLGRTRRTFNYKEDFPESVPACMPGPFVRTFRHQNWVDGEDLVQAGDANGKDGFNSRFHKIEADLDNLGNEIHTLAQCVADMRLALSRMLDEVRAELNYINAQIYDGTRGPIIDPIPWKQPPLFVDQTPRFLGSSKLLGQEVMMWQTNEGVISLPLVEKSSIGTGPRNKATWPGAVTKFMQDDTNFKSKFTGPFTVQQVVNTMGTTEVLPGVTLAEATQVLPPNAQYANPAAMSNDLAERTALSLHLTDTAHTALSSFSDTPAAGTTAAVGDLTFVSKDAGATLAKNGIKTAADLAAADPVKVNAMLVKDGLTQSVGETARIITNAGVMSRLAVNR